jgi:uncharacterized protein (TIGR02118 family)
VIKLVAMLKRRSDLSLEEFLAYYTERHVPLFARTIPPEVADSIKHYVQNRAIRLPGNASDPAFDCVTEFGFDDLDGLRTWTRWYLSPEGQVLRDDEENFMDIAGRVVVVTEEHHQPHR